MYCDKTTRNYSNGSISGPAGPYTTIRHSLASIVIASTRDPPKISN